MSDKLDRAEKYFRELEPNYTFWRESLSSNLPELKTDSSRILCLAVIDWHLRQKSEVPVLVIVEFLKASRHQFEEAAEDFIAAWRGESPFKKTFMTIADGRYVSVSEAKGCYDIKQAKCITDLDPPLIDVRLLNLTGLLYHLYASLAKANDEDVPEFKTE